MATATSFVIMDLFAQYLQVIDPIDSVSVMFLRMIVSLVVSYAYLYGTGQPDLPFGPGQYRSILVLRSCLIFSTLLGFFYAVRHITRVEFRSYFPYWGGLVD